MVENSSQVDSLLCDIALPCSLKKIPWPEVIEFTDCPGLIEITARTELKLLAGNWLANVLAGDLCPGYLRFAPSLAVRA